MKGMIAAAIAAAAISATSTAKAGATEDMIAAAMNDTGLISGVTGKTVKQKTDFSDPVGFNDAMIASVALVFTNPGDYGDPTKITASKLFAFYQKGLPEYSPYFSQWAIQAAGDTSLDFKYKDTNARIKDIAKIAGTAIKNGLKAYKGTRNDPTWTGLPAKPTPAKEPLYPYNIANVVYQATASLGGNNLLTPDAISAVTKSMVKAAAKYAKISAFNPGSVVVGFIAQAGGTGASVNENVTQIIAAGTKNAKKYALQIAQTAAYALYGIYKAQGGALSATLWTAANLQDLRDAVELGIGPKGVEKLGSELDTVLNSGALQAQQAWDNPALQIYGSAALSNNTIGGLFAINNGTQAPVTTIDND